MLTRFCLLFVVMALLSPFHLGHLHAQHLNVQHLDAQHLAQELSVNELNHGMGLSSAQISLEPYLQLTHKPKQKDCACEEVQYDRFDLMAAMLGVSVEKIATSEKVSVTEVRQDFYALIPAFATMGMLGGVVGGAAIASKTKAPFMLALVLTAGGMVLPAWTGWQLGSYYDPASEKTASWPHRIELKYTAQVNDKKITGSCLAYFFDSANKANRIRLKKEKGQVVGLSTDFEIDRCTDEQIFPEKYSSTQMRTGASVDATDKLLGQDKVAAVGELSVSQGAQEHDFILEVKLKSHDIQFQSQYVLNN